MKAPAHDAALEGRLDYRFLHAVHGIYGRAYQRIHIHNPCPLPARGPALIASNHTAGLDPSTIQAACHRPIFWVMTREYYDLPVLNWFFRWIQMVPIHRTGRDAAAWREAFRHLKSGHVVGIFPEGRIERQRKLLPFQTGVALLAMRAGVDLYPVYLDGLQRNGKMAHVYLTPHYPSIAWGEPIRVARSNPDRAAMRALTDQLQQRVEDLSERFPAPRIRGRSPLRA